MHIYMYMYIYIYIYRHHESSFWKTVSAPHGARWEYGGAGQWQHGTDFVNSPPPTKCGLWSR